MSIVYGAVHQYIYIYIYILYIYIYIYIYIYKYIYIYIYIYIYMCVCDTLPLDNPKTHSHLALPYITWGLIWDLKNKIQIDPN